jgi:hypothetical protein
MTLTTKETSMKSKVTRTLALAAGVIALTLSLSAGDDSASASSERKGRLHVTKECSEHTGLAGQFCTVTSSNFAAIKVGSKIFYDLPAGIPAGLLDSDIVLDAGAGNRAVGHCTLDLTTGIGLCTLSDGMGLFAGFQARVDVTHTGGANWRWDGTFSVDHIK